MFRIPYTRLAITWHRTYFTWLPGIGYWGSIKTTGYTIDWLGLSFGYTTL